MTSSNLLLIAVVCAVFAGTWTGGAMFLLQPTRGGRSEWVRYGSVCVAVCFYVATAAAVALAVAKAG